MNLISWIRRGLGRPRAIRALQNLISSNRPTIVGLLETKLSVREWDTLRVKVGFQNCFVVGKRGISGGMTLLWNTEVDVTLLSYSDHHIDVLVKTMEEFRLTLFYGNPSVAKRKESWNLLKTLASANQGPWMVFGDFNEILYSWEMAGVQSRDKR